MARTKKNEKAEKTLDNLTTEVYVNGIITEIYEGEKADYISVKTNTGNEYYDNIKIVDENGVLGEYNEGDKITGIPCTVSSYFDKVKKCNVITFKPVSNP